MSHRLLMLLLVLGALGLGLTLSACGKKGPLEPPSGKESTYPGHYPK